MTYEIPQKIVLIIKSIYNFTWESSKTNFSVTAGMGQGCCSLSLLYNLTIEWVIRQTTETQTNITDHLLTPEKHEHCRRTCAALRDQHIHTHSTFRKILHVSTPTHNKYKKYNKWSKDKIDNAKRENPLSVTAS